MQTIEEMVKRLPPEFQVEVANFVEFLLKKRQPTQKNLRLTWAGGLQEFRGKFTSLQLQKKALEWWGD
ncbi:MAG: DUF2281 domain-containing protein [Candidatus Omnitrophica bacterium]|nr:DUF2281 domain-containing protein [Candidatus Omnitrophota bacterium]